MANVANFVSILLATVAKSTVLFLLCLNIINLPLHCSGNETSRDFKKTVEEFQNGEDNVDMFAKTFKRGTEKEFGQLKSRVIISDGRAVREITEKEDGFAKHRDRRFFNTNNWDGYGVGAVNHDHNVPHTHVVQTSHRQPGLGVRRTLLKRRLRRILLELGKGRKRRPFITQTVPHLPLPIGDHDHTGHPDESTFEGSYVATSGKPGSRTVHVVNGRGGVNLAGTTSGRGIFVNGKRYRPVDAYGRKSGRPWINGPLGGVGNRGILNPEEKVLGYGGDLDDLDSTVFGFRNSGRKKPNYFLTDFTDDVGYSPLPRCSYINTDFVGDDVGDGKGISTGSAINCKQACQNSDTCKFYTYRDGWARDCYLKRGRRGDPNPQSAIPKIGFISGTKGNDDCLCLPNGQDTSEEVCPVRSTRPVYPWKKTGTRKRNKQGNDGTFRFDYDDYDYSDRISGIDPGVQGSVTVVTDEADSNVEPTTPRTTRRGGGRRSRPRTRGRGTLTQKEEEEASKNVENEDIARLQDNVLNKIDGLKKNIEDDEKKDVEIFDTE